ncbi:cell division protein ZapA [Moraxella lincolnii]|uniref:cell division protein ZapA n=1 Tax=Lwoffella lincolnii TaxID=90241 RepID=UPI00130163BD|nr:cell division protein ZapA [Moraxella lincolnii]
MSQQKTNITNAAIKTFSSLFSSLGNTVNNKAQSPINHQPNDTDTDIANKTQQMNQHSPKPQTKGSLTMQNLSTQKPTNSKQTQHITKKSETKLVDVVISGVTYPIQCPANEVHALQKASDFINQFIGDIRKQAPTLSHENLLVLCCLNLYEQIDSQKSQHKHHQLENERMQVLIKKISQDAQSILPD